MSKLALLLVVAGMVAFPMATATANITFPWPEEEPKPVEPEPAPDIVVDTPDGLLPGFLTSVSVSLLGVWLARRLRANESTLHNGAVVAGGPG